MKKILFGLLLLFLGGLIIFWHKSPAIPKKVSSPTPTSHPQPMVALTHSVLFVPYWTLDSLAPGYDTYVYFGITPNSNGIDTTDNGYNNLLAFASLAGNSHTLLAVRMLDKDFTATVLENTTLREQIIQASIATAQMYHFDGIVLDLEYSGIAFPSVTKSITDFSTTFAKETKSQNLSYYQMFAGDTFYLARPFDVAAIAKDADGIYVMSYDFHKANGTPGPNFPLEQLPDADYDFTNMLSDFSRVVPKNKLTIIFGMFGYDWTVDGQGRPIKSGESLTTAQITKKFIPHCPFAKCSVQQNNAGETNITYVDAQGQRHIVWFENLLSVAKKETVLRRQGFSQVGFWANGYF